MPDTETNARPDNFANAPLDEAVERFVRIIRAERPQVIITYRDEQNFYPHPDHIRTHVISGPAFDAAGDPDKFPDAGDPWQPSKLYYVSWSIARVKALHQAYLDRGEESAYASWFETRLRHRPRRRVHDAHRRRATTSTSAGPRCSRTARRSTPKGHWMRLPDDVIREVFPWEEFRSPVRSSTTAWPRASTEDDLFAGLRVRAPGAVERGDAMPQYLSQDWLDQVAARRGQPERPGASARIQWSSPKDPTVTSSTGGGSSDGKVLESGDGHSSTIADYHLHRAPARGPAKMHEGTLDPTAGFMRGQVKMAGDFGALLQFLPLTNGAGVPRAPGARRPSAAY